MTGLVLLTVSLISTSATYGTCPTSVWRLLLRLRLRVRDPLRLRLRSTLVRLVSSVAVSGLLYGLGAGPSYGIKGPMIAVPMGEKTLLSTAGDM